MKHIFTFALIAVALLSTGSLCAQALKTVDNSQNAGKVEWVERQINAGNVPFGVPVTREFHVKNISSENLIILQVKSTCHCTTTEWQRDPVPPGKTGVIKVTYDGLKEGDFYRIVSVSTNFDSMQTIPLALVGKVDKQSEAAAGSKN